MFKLKPTLALVFSICLPCTASLFAQSPPATDIHLLEIKNLGERIELGAPHNITNRDGYDNQPSFWPDGQRVLYTSIREGQADIYVYSLVDKSTQAMTQTPESEYSPTPMPDSRSYSVVRVELDTMLVQRLWAFPIKGGEPQLILEKINPVGYHAWGDEYTLGLFVLGNPPTFQLVNTQTGDGKILAEGVGRSMHKIPGQHAISFTTKPNDKVWWINRLGLDSQQITRLTQTLPGSEDYAWLPDGSMLMGSGSKLYRWQAESPNEWQLLADFSADSLHDITRIAVSPDGQYLAVVSDR